MSLSPTYCMRLENSFFFKLRIVLSFCERFSVAVWWGRTETRGKAGLLNMITICVMNEGSFSKKISERFSPFCLQIVGCFDIPRFCLAPDACSCQNPFFQIPHPVASTRTLFSLRFLFISLQWSLKLLSAQSTFPIQSIHINSPSTLFFLSLFDTRSLLWLRRPCQAFHPMDTYFNPS